MILMNMYGKIKPQIISKKLGIGICNPAPDWVNDLQNDIEEEILIHKHKLNIYQKDGIEIPSFVFERYNIDEIIKRFKWEEDEKSAKQIIAEHLIEIQVFDFDNSLLKQKNELLDSPTCEPQYAKLFLNFCCMVQSSSMAKNIIPNQVPFMLYDSDDFYEKPRIINFLEAMINLHSHSSMDWKCYTDGGIKSLEYIGSLVDEFLISEEHFWLFDYIINAVYTARENQLNAYHVFKVMSLIEMIIVNPKNRGHIQGEIENKLPQFLPDSISYNHRIIFCQLMRKLRNKIGHGDYKAVQKILEEYRNLFMQNYVYDEFEYSIENWTYLNICVTLDETLNNIFWMLLYDTNNIRSIQNS